jgi:predicted methyltransferase/DNA-directed RNA polymerase subunit RPC12/RpoP
MTHAGQDVLEDVAAAVDLSEGPAAIHDVLRAIGRREPVAVRALSRATELPVPIVSAICNELRRRGVVSERRPVQLTEAGRTMFAARSAQLRLGPDVLAGVRSACRGGPPARVDLDQVHCTYETKLRRIELLDEAGALAGKRVLLLGDDDLMSVALAVVARRFDVGVRALAVVDVDRPLLEFLRRALRDAPFPVEVVEHDLREPLPARLRGHDTVFTDPPYTGAGATLFLSRAAEAVAGAAGRQVFLAYGARRPEELLAAQRAIAELGFVVRRLERNFNEYVGAGTLGGSSHLYELVATHELRPLVHGSYGGLLYTGDFSTPMRLYRCTRCGTRHRVGRGQRYTSVEALKAQGCRRCGHDGVAPLPRSH